MPIFIAESQPKRGHERRWVALALAALVPAVLFAYSWYEPVYVRVGPRTFTFGALYGDISSLGPGWHRFPNAWELVIDLPGRIGLYHVSWVEPRNPGRP